MLIFQLIFMFLCLIELESENKRKKRKTVSMDTAFMLCDVLIIVLTRYMAIKYLLYLVYPFPDAADELRPILSALTTCMPEHLGLACCLPCHLPTLLHNNSLCMYIQHYCIYVVLHIFKSWDEMYYLLMSGCVGYL